VSYETNSLNQYTTITNPDPGKRTVRGQIKAAADLDARSRAGNSVDSPQAITRTGTGENQQFTTTTEAETISGPAWRKVTIEGKRTGAGKSGGDITVRKEAGFYFPPATEVPNYDADGNLLQDGRWDYEWDGENRLKSQQTSATAYANGVPGQRLDYTYDGQSRRVRKVVKEWNAAAGAFTITADTWFIYDGWNLIAELEGGATGPVALQATHAWGLDLSGTTTGAGGVGGLVFTKLYSTTQTTANNSQPLQTSLLAPCYDGNGNILAYCDATTAQVQGRYEYDPFGKLLLREEHPRIAGRLSHLFSTKYFDAETGLSYYGFRYYSPELGRWINRDPIFEIGSRVHSANLNFLLDNPKYDFNNYLFCLNNSTGSYDYLGMTPATGAVVGVAIGDIIVSLGVTACIVDIVWEFFEDPIETCVLTREMKQDNATYCLYLCKKQGVRVIKRGPLQGCPDVWNFDPLTNPLD
jgi:RHS repeat-associated protein